MRRLVDFAFAAVALLALTPVILFCWILVRFTSRGPVFFSQLRMGRNEEEFTLYKFRSMRIRETSHAPSHTVQDDDRITPVGRFLRRYKLDELPQFWNVLRGDMSLVGPRPKLPHHEALCMPYRPGLTGRATLAFRNEEQILLSVPRHHVDQFYQAVIKPMKAELDAAYMEHATFSTDMRMVRRTFTSCLNCTADPCEELAALLADSTSKHDEADGDALQPALVTASYDGRLLAEMADVEFAGDLDDAA
jgi:lipopolysaccharide/colanic/teichoic acid biosynthesis glycosyltransferase